MRRFRDVPCEGEPAVVSVFWSRMTSCRGRPPFLDEIDSRPVVSIYAELRGPEEDIREDPATKSAGRGYRERTLQRCSIVTSRAALPAEGRPIAAVARPLTHRR